MSVDREMSLAEYVGVLMVKQPSHRAVNEFAEMRKRIAALDKKVSVIYGGYEVWQKIKETCPETTMSANDMGDVLDAIACIWKEQGDEL